MSDILTRLLEIPSKTHEEQKLVKFLKEWFYENIEGITLYEHKDSLICVLTKDPSLPHIALVGHLDVVPDFFEPYFEGDRIYGAGASDMKASLACFLSHFAKYNKTKDPQYNFSMVLYSREEGTPLEENGLYDLIQFMSSYFNTIDLAIVGEPTDQTIQIGCVGSIHAKVRIYGKSCHSARPWEGENALYKAQPFISKIAEREPVEHHIFGVNFFDVIQITESHSEKGRTTLPDWWEANINFRFAPVYTIEEAEEHLKSILVEAGAELENIEILDSVSASSVIESDLYKTVIKKLHTTVRAKQAWTDVAQFSSLGIPAFNYGPGFTSQAHKKNEFCSVNYIESYLRSLSQLL